MSYSQGGLIEATDYNGFVASVNANWGVGSGDRGYGQTNTLSTVAATNTVTATQWATLIARIDSMRQHQSGVTSGLTQPTVGDTIAFLSTLSGQISTIDTNRLSRNVGVTQLVTANASGTWNGTVQAVRECRFTFASANAMRYFFNAGGTVTFNTFNSSFSGNTKSDNWNTIKGNASATVTNSVFWNNLSTSNFTLGTWSGSGADYNLNVLTLQARLDAAPGSSTAITLRAFFQDGASDTFDDTVLGTARVDAAANGAATTFLTNTWGTPTAANNVTVTQS
jgi:hypothetical protein